MMNLPTTEEVEKLTLRAIAVYAARCARRATPLLRGLLDDEIIELPLRMAEKLGSERHLDISDTAAAPLAAAQIAAAMDSLNTRQAKLAALSLTRVADVVSMVLNAATNPTREEWTRGQRMRAARSAVKTPVHVVHALGKAAASIAIEAARSDYEVLLNEFKEHQNVVLGEPIELSEEWWKKNRK